MRNFICPYCMNEYSKRKILYWCPECNQEVKPSSVFSRKPFKCNNKLEDGRLCMGIATDRKCFYCGEEIEQPMLETPNLPFSIIGVSSSGKTNYITVMLHELGHSGLNLAVSPQNIDAKKARDENYKRIYEEHKTPDPTPPGKLKPQIWEIKNNQRQYRNKVPTYTFTIFDGAGEDHEKKLDPTSNECNYIRASKAILLIIDPLFLSKIRSGGVVNSEDMKNSLRGIEGEIKNSEDIIMSLAKYIKRIRGIKTNKKLDIPVAVVLTKFDTVENHQVFGPLIRNKERKMSIEYQKSDINREHGKFNMGEIDEIHKEIIGWLKRIGEDQFITNLDSSFKNYCFFGVSSYGAPPTDEASTPRDIKPHRVLDPILWLFKTFNIID